MNSKKRILVAPLNWGLGHATRCIPIINTLIENNFEPIIASDGDALILLQKEYPNLVCLELPSYNITYTKNKNSLKWKLLSDTPRILKTIKKERELVKSIIFEHDIFGIISDNRYGVQNKDIPSVIITHQLRVLSGNSTWLSSKVQQKYIRKFDACWVPDFETKPNLSGKLGHLKKSELRVKYIGPISRFKKKNVKKKYDLIVILSGPEPQRTLLEEKLSIELNDFKGSVLLVQGVMSQNQRWSSSANSSVVNFMLHKELEEAINASEIVLSRSGYTTIMDLSILEKKAFFIPTAGQYEQEYLAKYLKKNMIAPSYSQEEFEMKHLSEVHFYKGLHSFKNTFDLNSLFNLFKSK